MAADVPAPIWPVTIARTRYGGTYEGGQWAAFASHPWQVPRDAFLDDITCSAWWKYVGEREAGVGATPEEALDSLIQKRERKTQ